MAMHVDIVQRLQQFKFVKTVISTVSCAELLGLVNCHQQRTIIEEMKTFVELLSYSRMRV